MPSSRIWVASCRSWAAAIRSQEDISDLNELVAARSASLFRTAYVVVGDQLAQDLLQEALVKAYVAWPRLRNVSGARRMSGGRS